MGRQQSVWFLKGVLNSSTAPQSLQLLEPPPAPDSFASEGGHKIAPQILQRALQNLTLALHVLRPWGRGRTYTAHETKAFPFGKPKLWLIVLVHHGESISCLELQKAEPIYGLAPVRHRNCRGGGDSWFLTIPFPDLWLCRQIGLISKENVKDLNLRLWRPAVPLRTFNCKCQRPPAFQTHAPSLGNVSSFRIIANAIPKKGEPL